MSEKKRGKLSTKETEFIKANAGSMDIRHIAQALNRTEAPVKKYLQENKILHTDLTAEQYDVVALKQKLHQRPYWGIVVQQVSNEGDASELTYFEATWIEVIKQFREDIHYTEELALKDRIILEIHMNRLLAEDKKNKDDVERLQKMLDLELAKDDDDRNDVTAMSLQDQILAARAAGQVYNSAHHKFLDRIERINKELKATREARVKNVEDSQSTWAGLIQYMDDAEVRERMGEEAEVMRLSAEDRMTKLGEYHEYVDGTVDQPILTPENVKDE